MGASTSGRLTLAASHWRGCRGRVDALRSPRDARPMKHLALAVALAALATPSASAATDCGKLARMPAGMDATAWTNHECAPRSAVDAGWERCLRRRDYTKDRPAGCPGSERCCPSEIVVRRRLATGKASQSNPNGSYESPAGDWWLTGIIIFGGLFLVAILADAHSGAKRRRAAEAQRDAREAARPRSVAADRRAAAWEARQARDRESQARADAARIAEAECLEADRAAGEWIVSLGRILRDTVDVGDRVRWESFDDLARPAAIVEHLTRALGRSRYPDGFTVQHAVSYDAASTTVGVDLDLPSPADVSDVCGYTLQKGTGAAKPVTMKAKDHDALYESAIKQAVLRTMREAFAAVDTPHVVVVGVSGWVTRLNKATGHEDRPCVISVSADRATFAKLNLDRVSPDECVRSLRGRTAGPLSLVAPVVPIVQLNRDDPRIIESRAILGELDSTANLAAMDWGDFEHLVRELFSKEFSGNGCKVEVTRSSRDGGVDAIAYDLDRIRGGTFIIQAKRYTDVVPVSAVRELYGAMRNEDATRAFLVTTSHFGADSCEFVKGKSMTLIGGDELVIMLARHGYKVRNDPKEARRLRLGVDE